MHPVCSLVASIDLADEVIAEPKESGEDTVECEGVPGDNLAARALAEFRSRAGKELPPLAITIRKRVPVAAGLGGGSADAAAALRIANQLAGHPLGREELVRLAAGLGSDVPSQLDPRHALVQGAGERDRAGEPAVARGGADPGRRGPLHRLPCTPSWTDSTARARRLDPAPLHRLSGIEPARAVAGARERPRSRPRSRSAPISRSGSTPSLAAGALGAAVSGSGPTCFGLFADRAAAERAAERLPGALVTAAALTYPPPRCRLGRWSPRWSPCSSRRTSSGAGAG